MKEKPIRILKCGQRSLCCAASFGTPFQEGDTARQMLRRMEGDPGALSQYGDAYDQVRYGENHATPQQGELAGGLVEKAAQKK